MELRVPQGKEWCVYPCALYSRCLINFAVPLRAMTLDTLPEWYGTRIPFSALKENSISCLPFERGFGDVMTLISWFRVARMM